MHHIAGLLSLVVAAVVSTVMILVPLAVAVGLGYGVSALTGISLPVAAGLVLGAMGVVIGFRIATHGVEDLAEIREILHRWEVREGEEDEEDDE